MRAGHISVVLFLGTFLICLQATESRRSLKKPTKDKTHRKYTLVTKTSTDAGAGTDDLVFLKLYGTSGQSVWTLFDNPHRNDLDQGTTETFDLTLPDLGDITRLDLKVKNKDSWKFDWIEVRDNTRNKGYMFGNGELLHKLKVVTLSEPKGYNTRRYKLRAKTSTDAGAGTDDHVYLKLYGTYGQSVWTLLDNPNRIDLEQGSDDTCYLTFPNLGEITRLDLKVENEDSWKFDWLHLDDIRHGKIWSFGGGLVKANAITAIHKPRVMFYLRRID